MRNIANLVIGLGMVAISSANLVLEWWRDGHLKTIGDYGDAPSLIAHIPFFAVGALIGIALIIGALASIGKRRHG